MRFTQIIAAAVLAAPLALAVPVSTPVTPATADLNSDLTTSLHYVAALRQIKEKYPELAQEDANIAARGYLEAVGVQRAGGFSNSTALYRFFLYGDYWPVYDAFLCESSGSRIMKLQVLY
ncbi:hypothetical protein TRIATDRAFT_131143 [Trichoderma atroviride IMI 206040]|uniref:Uncharacterized protein n=1 Tax=Hypocrea atroviridis (strain ATCC 20476 / IMI 206040) TaxID=452589 RepID=G9P218_HYPAI|nr:uncharacterized protein TRIATDRAFT_131143 [Trichoderma atroviride IMI 206040]EHK42613.1 hypothetical protein TRIATDRAFT_131143 [Trichoderma atroviride IMI 206040]